MTSERGLNGFSLIEAIVSIVMGMMVAAAALALLNGQLRYHGHGSEARVAHRTLRTVGSIVSAELRAVGPTDLLMAESDSVVWRAPLVRAVTCGSTGTDEIALFAYDSVGSANLPRGFRGTAVRGPYDTVAVFADGWVAFETPNASAAAMCGSLGVPTGSPASAFRTASGWTSGPGATPEQGSQVIRYGRLALRLSPNARGGRSLRRNGQEIAAWLDAGAAFEYVMSDGSIRASVAAVDLPGINAVRISFAATGGELDRFGVRRPLVHDVPLRR